MHLSPSHQGSSKKIYEIKNENRFVVLKEFDLRQSPIRKENFVRELLVGTLLRVPGLQKCSRFFHVDQVGL
jgi:hypothetical protein